MIADGKLEAKQGKTSPTSQERHPLQGGALAALSNAALVDALYERYQQDSTNVDERWQAFFQGFDLASCPRTCVATEQAHGQSEVASLIYAYRSQGHIIAQTNPLGGNPTDSPTFSLSKFGLSEDDLQRVFDTGHLGGPQRAPLADIIAWLRATYCGHIGVEYVHIQDTHVRRWLQAQMEPRKNIPLFSHDKKKQILENLVDAETFESFLQARYPGQKRFSLEGSESLIPAIHAVVEMAPEVGAVELVMGMAHRGRLNVLANILDKSYSMIFSEFEDTMDLESVAGDGDVKYHRGYGSVHVNHAGKSLQISLTSNPSHLEAVNPVVLGRTRSKQRRYKDRNHRKLVVPMLIHGDAAFAGQGLVAETLNLSNLTGYTAGGAIHIIINNQIGFTTSPDEARSTTYCTDVAKMVEAPIFHVNGDDPEAVVYVAELALRYRQVFGRDVVIDLISYRKYGHNEGDEPAFTQPLLYKKIRKTPPVRKLYLQRLVQDGVLSTKEAEQVRSDVKSRLQQAFEQVKKAPAKEKNLPFQERWRQYDHPYSHDPVQTGVPHPLLVEIGKALTTVPDGFLLNPKIARSLPSKLKSIETSDAIDWATAEALAFGSLVVGGIPVRLSGQDSARGTFSHRHAAWRDMETEQRYSPLNHVRKGQAPFHVYNSMLSEAGVLGFDYGYSLDEPNVLVIWEAQFGDFANGAQVIIDQFITSSLSKWQRASGLVMLLPHGYEGQGPEHSNAYMERYLAACAEENIQVANLTTPAQYFHALRRQIARDFRRPLVIMAPKSLLRHPLVVSPLEHLTDGHFHEILDDDSVDVSQVTRVVFCSGKVYFELLEARQQAGRNDIALIRLEQLYPLNGKMFTSVLNRYPKSAQLVWAQEEPRNRGGWLFVTEHMEPLCQGRRLAYAGRRASASPSPGSMRVHKMQQKRLVMDALGLLE